MKDSYLKSWLMKNQGCLLNISCMFQILTTVYQMSSGKFLNDYIENKIFDVDPFISIDEGVGELIEIASKRGKKQNKKIKLGICGEHGGEPSSVEFCHKVGMNYVSCSPFRVPIARISTAQANVR